uniref:RNase H type-1 domain-containing protein n=1 Tax=Nicotiana tabacum TaxID=4097 RepID=A0A1S3XE28_TOBAC|nr:PREDICTED: uncharacterized protein LOC107764205 [Nicotiana tabacum]
MESFGASKLDPEPHSGYLSWLQLDKHDDPMRDFSAHTHRRSNKDHFVRVVDGDMGYNVLEETDATESTAEELEQVVLFEKFLEMKFHLGTWFNPELGNVLHKPELSGRLAKWAVEISRFNIEYKPRTAINSQVLVDFVADFSPGLIPLAAKEVVLVLEMGVWTLFTDGASNIKGSGLGIVLVTPSGKTLRQAIKTVPLTNNKAEYEALVAGLELARGLDYEVITIKCDSQLVVNQVYGIFDIKDEHMQQYVNKVQALLTQFKEWSIIRIPREENVEADALANLGSSTKMKGFGSSTFVQFLHSILDVDGYYEVNSTNLVWDWRNEFVEYLRHGRLPEDPKASRALRTKATCYCLVDGQLYRR